MAKQRHTAEQIICKLREAEVELANGLKVPQVCKKLEVAEQTYYRWRKEYGGLRTDQASVRQVSKGGPCIFQCGEHRDRTRKAIVSLIRNGARRRGP